MSSHQSDSLNQSEHSPAIEKTATVMENISLFIIVFGGIFLYICIIINPILLIQHYTNLQNSNYTLTTNEKHFFNIAIACIIILVISKILFIINLYTKENSTTKKIINFILMICILIYVILTIVVCAILLNIDNTKNEYKAFPIIFFIIAFLIFIYYFLFGRNKNKIKNEGNGLSETSEVNK